MKNYWISWYSPKIMGGWELHSPWWISGYAVTDDEDVPTVCAAVKAEDEEQAKAKILTAYDVVVPVDAVTWRFVEERPDDWTPFNDRFPKAGWMQWA